MNREALHDPQPATFYAEMDMGRNTLTVLCILVIVKMTLKEKTKLISDFLSDFVVVVFIFINLIILLFGCCCFWFFLGGGGLFTRLDLPVLDLALFVTTC